MLSKSTSVSSCTVVLLFAGVFFATVLSSGGLIPKKCKSQSRNLCYSTLQFTFLDCRGPSRSASIYPGSARVDPRLTELDVEEADLRSCLRLVWVAGPPTGRWGRAVATRRGSSRHLVRSPSPFATSELARVDARRPPDHEVTPVLPARTSQDLPGRKPQFSQCFWNSDHVTQGFSRRIHKKTEYGTPLVDASINWQLPQETYI